LACQIMRNVSTRAVIAGAEPQLFVADIKASCEFSTSKLGFSVGFTYGEPALYARSSATAGASTCAASRRGDRCACATASSCFRISDRREDRGHQALFLEFQAAGVTFFQTLKREPWRRGIHCQGSDGFAVVRGPAE